MFKKMNRVTYPFHMDLNYIVYNVNESNNCGCSKNTIYNHYATNDEYVYDLWAIVCHIGTGAHGHYVVIDVDPILRKYVLLNDSSPPRTVNESYINKTFGNPNSSDQENIPTAFMLLYIKRDTNTRLLPLTYSSNNVNLFSNQSSTAIVSCSNNVPVPFNIPVSPTNNQTVSASTIQSESASLFILYCSTIQIKKIYIFT